MARVLERFPILTRMGKSIPVKTLTLLSTSGTMLVIYATISKLTFWTFGASCCALAAACLTLGMRAPVDEDIVGNFSPIMTGTLRQKMRTLHLVLQSLGIGFAYLGALMIAVARAHDDAWHWTAIFSGLFATVHDALSFLAMILLSLQLFAITRGKSEQEEEKVGYLALDAVSFAQISTLIAQGFPSISMYLVAFSILLLWWANAVQVHLMYVTPTAASGNEDSIPFTSSSASVVTSTGAQLNSSSSGTSITFSV